MVKLRKQIVSGLALMLVAGAALTARWVSRTRIRGGTGPATAPTGRGISDAHATLEEPATYRFLYRDETGALTDRLTLGRFVGDHLQEGARWGFVSIDQWHDRAPSLFDRERGWVAEDQPGWRISTWVCTTEPGPYDSTHLFWSLQALRFLDPGSIAIGIDMIESAAGKLRICLARGPSDYDYETDTLCWNPTETEHVPADAGLQRKWFRTDPLITLAHELSHAWYDLCRGGDGVSGRVREEHAVMTENRIRHILFLKDPTRRDVWPRSGFRETWSDLPGRSAEQAWRNYGGRVEY